MTNGLGMWPAYLRLASGTQLVWAAGKLSGVSLLALATAILIAGAKTKRVWQDEPASARQLWLRATFCRPILWVAFLQRWMRWKLEHNPIGWLGQRTWSGRLVTWGWFAVIVSLYSAALTDRDFFRGYSTMQRAIAWLLALTVGLSAAGSFQRERETGVLELLLVSPLGESAIIWGRLRGLWGQFLPAVTLLLGIWLYMNGLLRNSADGEVILFHAATFLTLPMIGLCFSLRCRGFISAFLWTLAVGLLGPLALSLVFEFVWWSYNGPIPGSSIPMTPFSSSVFTQPYVSAGCCQFILAAIFWQQLRRLLRKRSFQLDESRA
jgi:hypothetical protein